MHRGKKKKEEEFLLGAWGNEYIKYYMLCFDCRLLFIIIVLGMYWKLGMLLNSIIIIVIDCITIFLMIGQNVIRWHE